MHTHTDLQPALFTGQFVYLNVLFGLVYSNIAFFFVYPLFLESLGESTIIIGWVMGALPLSTVLVRPFMPYVIGRIGQQRAIGIGLIIIFASSLAYHLISHVTWLLFTIRILHGIGFSAFVAAAFTAAAHMVPPSRRAEAFGYIGALILSCVAAAPVMGERLVRGFGYPALFHGAAASAFLAMAVIFFARQWREPPAAQENVHDFQAALRNSSFQLVLLATLLFVNANATLLTYISLYGREQGFSGPVFFSWAAALAVAIRLFGSRLMDRYGKKIIAAGAFGLLGAGMLLITQMHHSAFIYIAAILSYGIGLGYLYPGMNALAVDQAEPPQRAIMMSLFTAVFDSGFMLGAVLSGFLAALLELQNMFLLIGLSPFLGVYLVTRPKLLEVRG